MSGRLFLAVLKDDNSTMYFLYCEHCGNRLFIDGKNLDDFAEVVSAPVPKKADGKSQETIKQQKKLKCNSCGFIFKIKNLEGEKPQNMPHERAEPVDSEKIFMDALSRKKAN